MRIRDLVLSALLVVPATLSGQGIHLPRIGRRTAPEPAALPPAAPTVARALAYKRSRWTLEGYSLITTVQMPAVQGGVTSFTTLGAGTHADYRYSNHFSATVDLTASPLGGEVTTETAELGTRFRPMAPDQTIRPFVDLRAGYMHMFDTFGAPIGGSGFAAATDQSEQGRYSRGLGSILGGGVEYSLTPSVALTTELSAMRNHMTNYRVTAPGTIPTGSTFWMTSFRYTFGIKYNPVTALRLLQKPQ
jgi:hypothetical protein